VENLQKMLYALKNILSEDSVLLHLKKRQCKFLLAWLAMWNIFPNTLN